MYRGDVLERARVCAIQGEVPGFAVVLWNRDVVLSTSKRHILINKYIIMNNKIYNTNT